MANKNSAATTAPMVTVVIPLYNAEKYIGQCLSALVEQTYKDFEVIVVDDCSTDNSTDVVKKFMNTTLKGKLKLKSLSKNSGASAVPKNTGVQLARSKYIMFCDSDDYFSKTAIEEMVKIAEETNAEVVHCSKYFSFKDGEDKIVTGTFQRTYHVDAPTLETPDIAERVKKFTEYGFLWWGQCKILRRDFLIKNKIQFPPINVWEDLVFAFMCVVCAKTYVRVPNIIHYYRVREDSLSHIPKDVFEIIETLTKVIRALDEFMDRFEIFQKNPALRFMLINWHVQGRLDIICPFFYVTNPLPLPQVDQLFIKKFSNKISKDYLGFMSYFFTMATFNRVVLSKAQQDNKALQNRIQELEMQLARDKVNSFIK